LSPGNCFSEAQTEGQISCLTEREIIPKTMKREDTTMNTNTVTSNTAIENDASDIIPGTNWTYSDAASMAKECAREERLFGRKSRSPRRVRPTVTAARRAADFLAQTGWTIEAAASMAKECMCDRRLFGSPAMYATV
jgi:hypothetical protein